MTDVPYYDDTAAWEMIPSHMQSGVELYVMRGIPPGSFLTHLMENDFLGAMSRADAANAANMKGWAYFLWNFVPAACHGSPDKVSAWIKSGGLVGRNQAEATKGES